MNLTLSPVSIRLEASPGENVNSKIKIRNNGNQEEKLKISVGTFVADPTGETPKLVEPTEKDKFISWLEFEENNFSVFPGEWKEVNFSIKVPQDASLSYYYLIYITQANLDTKEGETNIAGAPAISVLLNVKSPNTIRELKLLNFNTNQIIAESLPREFEVEVANVGNTHIAPFGNIFIDGQGKKDLAILPINPKDNVILPESTRKYKILWEEGFPLKGDGFLGYEWNLSETEKFRIGKYTAHVLLAYDNGERDIALESVLSFWIIPWKIILIAILVVVLALLGLWSTIKKPIQLIRKKFYKKEDIEIEGHQLY